MNRPISRRTAALIILLCTLVLVVGPLLGFRYIESSFEWFQAGTREVLPASGVDRWGFNLAPLLVDRSELVVPKIPRKDDIPSLVNPMFGPVADSGTDTESHVIGVTINGESRAWPLSVLSWHSVVNDTLGGEPVAVFYSTMAGMAAVCSRRAGAETLEFGISGLVYRCNLVLYDRHPDPNRESLWSLSQMRAISGPAAAAKLRLDPIDCDVLPLGEWAKLHPDTTVMTRYTNYQMAYDSAWLYDPANAPSGEDESLFDLKPAASKQQLKANRRDLIGRSPVVMVIGPKSSRGYPFADVFAAKDGIQDELDGAPFRLSGSGGKIPGIQMQTNGPLRRVYMAWFLWTALE